METQQILDYFTDLAESDEEFGFMLYTITPDPDEDNLDAVSISVAAGNVSDRDVMLLLSSLARRIEDPIGFYDTLINALVTARDSFRQLKDVGEEEQFSLDDEFLYGSGGVN